MMPRLAYCLAILRALGIGEVVYSLSGGGDDGTCDLDRVTYLDGRTKHTLPRVTIGINDLGQVSMLDELLDIIVTGIPDGDWINNAGGHGTVILRPQETDEDLQVECDMTYCDESDEGDFDEGDFDDDEFTGAGIDDEEADPVFAALTIDDSALQLPKGPKP